MYVNLHRHMREVRWGSVCGTAGAVQLRGGAFQQPFKEGLFFFNSVSLFLFSSFYLFPIKLLIEQENEQVDVDGGSVKELHHRHTFILQLEEILSRKQTKELQMMEKY